MSEGSTGWLQSAAGRSQARRALRHTHLPLDLTDDLVQDVHLRVLAAVARGVIIDNAEAFATTLLQRAAMDLLRGARRRPQEVTLGAGDERPSLPAEDDVAGGVAASMSSVAVRQALQGLLFPDPLGVAGGFGYLAVALEGAVPAKDCPQPAGGAGEDEAAAWAGLWYAGRDECFAGGTAAAVRQRRSRAVAAMRAALVGAAEAAGLADA